MLKRQKYISICGLLVATALALSWIERYFPIQAIIPIPGVKLGLANVVTLFALVYLSIKEAAMILLVRVTMTAIFLGTVTGFVFSLLGGFFALAIMWTLLHWEGKWFSFIGISIAGAAGHQIGQICAAILVLGTTDVLGYLPILLVAAIPMGVATGLVCDAVLYHLKKLSFFDDV